MCLTFFQPYTVAASAQIISLNITKGTITEVFKAIEDQSEYKFFYNDNQINLNKRVDVNIHEESIEQVLNNVKNNCLEMKKSIEEGKRNG